MAFESGLSKIYSTLTGKHLMYLKFLFFFKFLFLSNVGQVSSTEIRHLTSSALESRETTQSCGKFSTFTAQASALLQERANKIKVTPDCTHIIINYFNNI